MIEDVAVKVVFVCRLCRIGVVAMEFTNSWLLLWGSNIVASASLSLEVLTSGFLQNSRSAVHTLLGTRLIWLFLDQLLGFVRSQGTLTPCSELSDC